MEIMKKKFARSASRSNKGIASAQLRSARDIDKGLIRFSSVRAIISGDLIEYYSYEKPYSYNWAPTQKGSDSKPEADSKRNDHILRARRSIRRLIECNVQKDNLPIFLTLTFMRNIQTLEEANPLFTKFAKELQRRYGKSRYLCVPEFQKRGAVHYHVIFFDLRYIPRIKEVMKKLWVHGFSQVKAVRKIKSIGAYVSKYLQKGVGDERTIKKKGYFCSRGMERPIEYREQLTVDELLKRYIFNEEASEAFESRNGSVIYKRLRIVEIC